MNDIKSIYNNILKDKKIIDLYDKIEKFENNSDNGYAYHNFTHIKNVTNLVENILNKLDFDEEFIYKAKIACLLHDIGSTEGKKDHAIKSYNFAKKYFEENNINFKDIDMVLEAIKIHSNGFETDNIIALVLILADKLDVKKTRISEVGKRIIGNRQYSHIEDIKIDINDNVLKIKFITDGNIDEKELKDYYFTKKIMKAINSFSDKLKLQNIVYLDDKIFEI